MMIKWSSFSKYQIDDWVQWKKNYYFDSIEKPHEQKCCCCFTYVKKSVRSCQTFLLLFWCRASFSHTFEREREKKTSFWNANHRSTASRQTFLTYTNQLIEINFLFQFNLENKNYNSIENWLSFNKVFWFDQKFMSIEWIYFDFFNFFRVCDKIDKFFYFFIWFQSNFKCHT